MIVSFALSAARAAASVMVTNRLLCNSMQCLQDAKLMRLEASLHQREEQIENHHAERINALRARRSREVQQKLAYVHR